MVRPLHDKVIIRRVKEEATSPGGIMLPQQANEDQAKGVVVAVGPGRTLESGTVVPPAVCPGDTVLFGKFSGSEVELDGEKLLIMREMDIMAVIEL